MGARSAGSSRTARSTLDQENDHGVLFLDLGPRSYGWTFVRTDGSVGRSEHTAPEPCHPKTPG